MDPRHGLVGQNGTFVRHAAGCEANCRALPEPRRLPSPAAGASWRDSCQSGEREIVAGRASSSSRSLHTSGVDDERPPICPACGVTMVPTALSAREGHDGDWICLECETTGEPDAG